MNNLNYILQELMEAMPEYKHIQIPDEYIEKKRLMRSLMNLIPPIEMGGDFLKAQDEELLSQREEKGIINIDSIESTSKHPRLKLWQGDITRLKVDAIVNAANNQLLGCFIPLHACIDNAIHSAAGVQLRNECQQIMKQQGKLEATGKAKITGGYNLPAMFVIHTVGPVINKGLVKKKDEQLLASCYESCLKLADENKLQSMAFCCISTGEFRFPNQRAAEIAVKTVSAYFEKQLQSSLETIVFNVFKDVDYTIYQDLLQ